VFELKFPFWRAACRPLYTYIRHELVLLDKNLLGDQFKMSLALAICQRK